MEAHGAVALSLDYNLHYLTFLEMEIANLSKSIIEAELYGPVYKVEKVTVGHAQKHMGTALRKSRRIMVRESYQVAAQLVVLAD